MLERRPDILDDEPRWRAWVSRTSSILLAAAAALMPLQAMASGEEARLSPQSALDRFSTEYLSDLCRVGVSVAARIGGRTFFANRGSISRSRLERATADSVYELASVTKTFVGALAARALVERRMTLDGDFRDYLPGSYPNLARSGLPITLRSLATHTSGLQRDLPDSDALMAEHDYENIGDRLAALNRGYTREQSLADLHSVTLRSTPGAEFAYSNLGIRVIGYGLETAYHMPLKQLLKMVILDPLAMTSTGFGLDAGMRTRLVTPYNRYGHVQPLHDGSAGAAYGLYSTPRDMARYLTWELGRDNPVTLRSQTLIRGSSEDGQALIWNVSTHDGEPMLWHGGGSFGETSQIVLFPQDREGFVLLANDACEGSETALKNLAISVHDALHKPGGS